MSDTRVAILGCGTMGGAIIGGLLDGGWRTEQLRGTVRRAAVASERALSLGIEVGTDNLEAARWADALLLCVKPQSAGRLLQAPGMAAALEGKLLISLCAGLRLEQLAQWAPRTALVRAMPNTPCVIREGMTVISPGPMVRDAQLRLAEAIFAGVGRVRRLEEKHLDAVTGLSGSGPAFACVMIEALADGGVMMGLPRDVAVELAAQTVQGAGRLVLESGLHPAALKDQVTTPAGCTIAGLLMMEDGRIRSTLARTIQEATRVAGGLGD